MSSDSFDSQLVERLDRFWNRVRSPEASLSADAKHLDHYQLHEILGHGAFGVVYRATDLRTERVVAVKLARPEVLLDPEKRQRFATEAKTVLPLDHPHIVKVLDAAVDGPIPYIVSEYCPGPDLASWLQTHGPVSDLTAMIKFALQIVTALEYAHAAGIVHRDIKPSNILMVPHASEHIDSATLEHFAPKLTDFGLAKVFDAPLLDSRSSLVLGTPMYMAPEQILSKWGRVTARTDLFALGMLMLEMTEGRTLRYEQSYSEILSDLLSIERPKAEFTRPDVPGNLQHIINRCLEIDPMDRYESAAQVRADLDAILVGRPITADTNHVVNRIISWARNPDRPIQICYFLIPLHLALFAWMILCCALSMILRHNEFPVRDLLQAIAIAFVLDLGVVYLSLVRLKGGLWATKASLAIALVGTVLIPILAILDWVPSFELTYQERPYFDYATHGQVLIFGLFQSILLGISVFCDYCQRSRNLM